MTVSVSEALAGNKLIHVFCVTKAKETDAVAAHLRPAMVPVVQVVHHPDVCGHVGSNGASAAEDGFRCASGCLLGALQELGSRRHGLDDHGWPALLSLQTRRLQVKKK